MDKNVFRFLVLILFSTTISAQKNIVKAGFINGGGSNFGIQYERLLTDNFSLMAQYGGVIVFNGSYELTTLFGTGFYTEGRYYFSRNKDLMEGWHGGIYFNYMETSLESDFGRDELKRSGAGLISGYQWVFPFHMTMDILLGGGFYNTTTNLPDYHEGFFFMGGFNLGYNF
jgi:hypothetical protein